MNIDLLFANVPENLRVPKISASSTDVPQWNKQSFKYFEVLVAFANTNLHDGRVIVFTNAVDPHVSKSIRNWTHTEDFWFDMNDIDL